MINSEQFNIFQKDISALSFADRYIDTLKLTAELYDDIAYVDPEPLVRSQEGESTLFTSSGVQFLNRFLVRSEPMPDQAFLISQPVVRMNYLNKVGLGSYTNFVNFGTMKVNVGYIQHESWTAQYPEVLSFITARTVEVAEPTERSYLRDGLSYTTIQTNFSISGLEVADSLFHYITAPDGSHMTMSELGGGLERLLYGKDAAVLSETTGITNISEVNVFAADAYRGAVLIAANNVQPSNNNQGYQLRKLLKRIPPDEPITTEFITLLHDNDSAYQFWSRMGGVATSREVTLDCVTNELWRNINIIALQEAGIQIKGTMNLSVNPEVIRTKYRI